VSPHLQVANVVAKRNIVGSVQLEYPQPFLIENLPPTVTISVQYE
jgi:hypothetical protein